MANELRRYQNFIGGLIEDNPLASGATTLTSAALAAITGGVGSTEYMALTLDPDGIGGPPEVVWVTALTAGSVTATISRGKEGTFTRQHERDTPWVHSLMAGDAHQHAAKVWRSAAFSCTVGSAVVVPFDTEIYDYSSAHAAGVYTVPVPGVYEVMSRTQITSPANTERWLYHVYVNGTEMVRGTDAVMLTGGNVTLLVMGHVLCAAGATIDVRVQQIGGTARALEVAAERNCWATFKQVV